MAHGAAADVVLAHIVDLQCAHHAHARSQFFQRVLHGECVDHRGQHAHLVTGHPVHAAGSQARTAEDVAPADDQADFRACIAGFDDLAGDTANHRGIDAVVF